jgi:hypothetical protein
VRARIAAAASCVVALAVPAPASAKGPSKATVTGPGIAGTLALGGGEVAGSPVMAVAESAGFFPSAFPQTPDPMLGSRPAGPLGPKYTVRWVVPTGHGLDHITQNLYPYAKPDPVAYMPSGQPLFDMRTRGGWFRGSLALKQVLVSAGLPTTAPHGGVRSGVTVWAVAVVGAGLAVAVVSLTRSSIARWSRNRSTSAIRAPTE